MPEMLSARRASSGPSVLLRVVPHVLLRVFKVGLALIRRPDLWSTSLRAGLSLAPSGWWRRAPYLPLPDSEWLRFRMSTAYGGDGRLSRDSAFEADDLITWLEWRKSWPG